ncbi:helix-turn-helix transcriptional regulator [Micromonospora tarensis]|uniref:Helix-turn-helix transcriptional regulator n=1 Tax=Micromonospora tarensis TaxID=2806100 RepID=A0ABS1YD81_9ACTN|nr:helix-turn-helix transcriptional regulator [Micromonospora tarensis]MBM0275365.1 helix-turn-helix transcriptional regulator [Micromonospora tarensis]
MLETQGTQQAGRPRVVLLVDEFDRITTALGLLTDAGRAAFLGVSPAALSKIRNGVNTPSADFIAAVRTALPAVPYERLFTERPTT